MAYPDSHSKEVAEWGTEFRKSNTRDHACQYRDALSLNSTFAVILPLTQINSSVLLDKSQVGKRNQLQWSNVT